jgi:hypothetical protein
VTHRSNQRGTYRIDRILPPPIGRIARASGTTDPQVFAAIVGTRIPGRGRRPGMLDLLHTPLRRYDLLRGIRDGQLTAAQVHAAWVAGELATLEVRGTEQPLKPALEAWLEQRPNGDTRRGYRGELVRAGALKAGLPIAELPALLRAYREACQGKRVFRAFNLARAAALAFLRDGFGTRSAVYAEVKDLRPLARTAPRRLPPALTHAEFLALCAKLPAEAARCAQGMAYTGMNPKEYWGRWADLGDRIHVEGTKRAGRVRDVPRLAPLAPPAISRATFQRQLRAAAPHVSPKHCRNFFARWCDEAGIPAWRRESYLGHGVRRMEELYPRADVERFLAEDGPRLATYLALRTKDTLRLVRPRAG